MAAIVAALGCDKVILLSLGQPSPFWSAPSESIKGRTRSKSIASSLRNNERSSQSSAIDSRSVPANGQRQQVAAIWRQSSRITARYSLRNHGHLFQLAAGRQCEHLDEEHDDDEEQAEPRLADLSVIYRTAKITMIGSRANGNKGAPRPSRADEEEDEERVARIEIVGTNSNDTRRRQLIGLLIWPSRSLLLLLLLLSQGRQQQVGKCLVSTLGRPLPPLDQGLPVEGSLELTKPRLDFEEQTAAGMGSAST